MRTTPLLLALSLLTPALAGCPPVRGDDDDDSSVGDDDDSVADAVTVETGRWASVSLNLLSDSCSLQEQPGVLSYDVLTSNEFAFVADWGVDESMQCTVASGGATPDFDCEPVEFFIAEEPDGTTLRGSLEFDGSVLSATEVRGDNTWVVTCSGPGCDGYELPTDVTCTFSFDAIFEPVNEPEEEPDPIPGDGGDEDGGGDEGEDDGDEGEDDGDAP